MSSLNTCLFSSYLVRFSCCVVCVLYPCWVCGCCVVYMWCCSWLIKPFSSHASACCSPLVCLHILHTLALHFVLALLLILSLLHIVHGILNCSPNTLLVLRFHCILHMNHSNLSSSLCALLCALQNAQTSRTHPPFLVGQRVRIHLVWCGAPLRGADMLSRT